MVESTISHYKILKKIGQGGMGEVYLAEDTRLQRKVAVKILPAAAACIPEGLARFEREAGRPRPSITPISQPFTTSAPRHDRTARTSISSSKNTLKGRPCRICSRTADCRCKKLSHWPLRLRKVWQPLTLPGLSIAT